MIWRLLDNNELFNIFNKSSYESSEKNIDKIIEKYKLTEEEIINFKYNLHYTCSYNDVINEKEEPLLCNRVSEHRDDLMLVKLFKLLHIYFFNKRNNY